MPKKGCRRWFVWLVGGLLGLCLVGTAVSALSNLGLPAESDGADRLSQNQKALLLELSQVRQTIGDAVWPGWGQAVIPAVVYNEAYTFLIDYVDPPDGWQRLPDLADRGGAWELVPDDLIAGQPYYRQKLPASGETPQAFTVMIGDQWATSMTTKEWMEISLRQEMADQLPDPLSRIVPYRVVTGLFIRGSDGYISLLAHESFHAYQGSLAPNRLVAAEAALHADSGYPWAESEADWQVELDLLVAALEAKTVAETASLSRQFLNQRQQRRLTTGLSDAEIAYEQQREWLEGLARYVELETWRQADLLATYDPVAALTSDRDFDGYGTFDRRWRQEIDQIGRMASDEGETRFYYTGMAQGVLLDRLLPDWKEQIFAEGVFLEDILETAVSEN